MANTGSDQAAHHYGSPSLTEPSRWKPALWAAGAMSTREPWETVQSSTELPHPSIETAGVLAAAAHKGVVSLYTSACIIT